MHDENKDHVTNEPKADVVRVRFEGGVREFTKEKDGTEYVDLASKFAAEGEGRAVI